MNKAEVFFNEWKVGKEAEVMDAKFRMIKFAEDYHQKELERITGLKRPQLFRDDVIYVAKDTMNFKYQEALKLLKK